jgi:hypothetical protein
MENNIIVQRSTITSISDNTALIVSKNREKVHPLSVFEYDRVARGQALFNVKSFSSLDSEHKKNHQNDVWRIWHPRPSQERLIARQCRAMSNERGF